MFIKAKFGLFACTLWFACAGFAFAQESKPSTDPSRTGVMPTIKTETLNERAITLPQELPGEKTLVFIAFDRSQQKEVDSWVAAMQLNKSPIAWIEIPLIEPKNRLVRSFIQGGMRRGITDEPSRERTITVFAEIDPMLKAMGLPTDQSSIVTAVVTRSGQVLAHVKGPYGADKASIINAALKP
jgi:hypothetical protein